MRGLKLKDRSKTTQVHALNTSDTAATEGGGATSTKVSNHHEPITISSILSSNRMDTTTSVSAAESLLSYGLPTTDLLEPSIDPHLKSIDLVSSLSDLYRRIETCPEFNKSLLYIEQYALLCSLGDPKLLRRCLQSARQHAVDVHCKVVLSAWLRYERTEDDTSSLNCVGRIAECPKVALVHGYDMVSIYDHCKHCHTHSESSNVDLFLENELDDFRILGNEWNVCFCIGVEEVNCVRFKIAALSSPLKSMLYGGFMESKTDKIDFSRVGISVEGMRAVEVFSRTSRLDTCSPKIVLELLSFANQFLCEELKVTCDVYLASLVCGLEEALVLIDYGLEERANSLVASCLQVLLRELPGSLSDSRVVNIFCSPDARERLALVGHASFLLYYFLSQVAMEQKISSNIVVMCLERLRECGNERWQKALASHQLGCVLLERREYKNALCCFEVAAETGHVYSMAGVARTKSKQGHRFSAYEMINFLISEYKPIGWMYQERSLYNMGRKKILDLDFATALDPTLTFPYEYRAVAMLETDQVQEAISEINKIIGFKLSPECLELRAWFFLGLEDYEAALRDIRALLTLEPNFMMFHGKIRGDHLVELLGRNVQQWSAADCWLQLYDRWSSIDDIGSLAVIHQMLINEPGKSLLRFRQSLLLLRLNCQKAATRSLQLARRNSNSEHERLVYEGWILYDTGHREEALSKAEESIFIQRSFEAFFLKAYILADTTLDSESSAYVIQLLKDALRCPSDGLRKGQALNNLGSIYADCGKLEFAADCYVSALDIKHTRAHQGLARIYHLKNERKVAYDEMTKLIEKAQNSASAYEKRSEYCDRDMASNDLSLATQLDPLRTYPYRYRAAVLMDDQKEAEAVEELNKAIAFRPDLQMLHLRAAFHESIGDFVSAHRDCEAALCLDPNHKDTVDLYKRIQGQAAHLRM
ncbi:hypothetical protein RJ639_003888 [Escallonia herrerae]|uniref:Ethylene-overproduction protein 1 n=1 Tax=Escallonia herrerae TaxID=1293975 RepID=A0AA88W3S0_9ASTE|nr:hypothetical protein RJ639_003888 [Escallonia herrerae]